jgi:transposase InsO family protein
MAGRVVAMEKRLLAVFTAGLSSVNVTGLCSELGISRQSFYKYRRRYVAEGAVGLVERSRRPGSSPLRTPPEVEEAIIRMRKELAGEGSDCGAQSIAYMLSRRGWEVVPSVATIHRVLVRRGQVIPQPEKRPRSAGLRFQWEQPNDAWQIDATRWVLSGRGEIWIMDLLDDRSRLVPAAMACAGPTTEAAWEAFSQGIGRFGLPARVISDNGTCFTGRFLDGEVAFEQNLRAAGIRHICSSPGHPQTCGKLERWHQTLKKWLRARPLAGNIEELQTQLDQFLGYYNTNRPHRALAGATPLEVWQGAPKATPGPPIGTVPTARVLTVDSHGRISLAGFVIQIGAPFIGHRILAVTRGDQVSIFDQGRLIHSLQIDPTRRYQPNGQPTGRRPKLNGPCN